MEIPLKPIPTSLIVQKGVEDLVPIGVVDSATAMAHNVNIVSGTSLD
jgi:hypothetical protein